MAKPTAPLLSFKASGTIAKTQVYASWRGRNYVRQHVVPHNPRTTAQVATRNVFTFLSEVWKRMAPGAQTPWTAYAMGKPITNRNALNQFNLGAMKSATSDSPLIGSPGANAGLPLFNVTSSSPVAGHLSLAWTAPSAPTGWTLTSVDAVCIVEEDPTTVVTDYNSYYGTAASTPTVITGIPSGDTNVFAVWPVWLKPDSSIAYGPSLNGTQLIS